MATLTMRSNQYAVWSIHVSGKSHDVTIFEQVEWQHTTLNRGKP